MIKKKASDLVQGDIVTHIAEARGGHMVEIPVTLGDMIVHYAIPGDSYGRPVIRVYFTNYIPMVMPPERELMVHVWGKEENNDIVGTRKPAS